MATGLNFRLMAIAAPPRSTLVTPSRRGEPLDPRRHGTVRNWISPKREIGMLASFVSSEAPSPGLYLPEPLCCYPVEVCGEIGSGTMRANRIEYLFSVNTHTPPTMTVDSGEEFTVEVRGAFDDVEDISAVPTPFTPACDGHPLAPIAGPIVVRGAEPGDVVAIDLIELTPFGVGKSAILRDFGVLRRSSRSRWRSPRRCTTAAPGSAAAAFRCRSTPISARSRRCRPRATNPLTPAPTAAISIKRTRARGAGSISRFW